MGYTNPYASSTGLNFLMSCLYAFDYDNPLSDTATEMFQQFQANVPVVSYNTVQMQGAINSGVLDGMVLRKTRNLPKNTDLGKIAIMFLKFLKLLEILY